MGVLTYAAEAPVASGIVVAGRYRLCSVLGRGGMGTVWLAQDELMERWVALKQVDLGSDWSGKQARARALAEARAASRVEHPGAVRIHDVVRDDDQPWIVMEALSGQSLGDAVKERGPMPVEQVVRIGHCIVDVLDAAHRAGVVHRDVKPGNVQLCDDGRVVLLDFGVAHVPGADWRPPPGGFAGSPAFVSPEQLQGGEPDPASDLFSLGATLYAAVEGRSPFDRGDLFATVLAVAEGRMTPFRLAGRLRPVLEGLLQPRLGRRWSAARTRAALLNL
ncbi:hypothetical protein Ade02nite_55520 [Paractinoplanes deccanensis]|uniref:non-specific serine/threonine protein kinase n=1 Tax=Paractinoplanes deccanensis TaxID=113561 RepID=A0ABQ3YA81_9ACTN|nr:serine/threonine-protein kinase [Actinoplanes deccanensis]GID76911.1 hypothetical protein Ade02nite_55520 [Actinoplanes deccanensis]